MSEDILASINSPEDVRALDHTKLPLLASNIREKMIEVVSKNGGHLSSNLGIVELTLALHRVFDFKKDRLIFDVGHQCYTHKMITGRNYNFHTIRTKDGISGFPNPNESEYDPFVAGHSSTSISSATGVAAAARIAGTNTKAIAVIGDGALGGGMCFEAMNHAGHSNEDVLIIVNDNEMAISKTVGAFSKHLEDFRLQPSTNKLRKKITAFFHNLPLLGGILEWLQEKLLSALKNHPGTATIFEAMGFRYFGPFDGHDIESLEVEIRNLSQLKGPRIMHVVTEKGRGFSAALKDPESFHSSPPFSYDENGKITIRTSSANYSSIFAQSMLKIAKKNERVLALTAAMTAGTGMSSFASKFPDRFIDVGMAESHAIPYAAALAKEGFVPVVAIYSTFLQRGYDQIFHDITLQPDLPIVLALDRAGLVAGDGPTHHGIYDIAYMRHLSGLTLLAPRDGTELEMMLEYATELGKPCAIRYPRGGPASDSILPQDYQPIEYGKAEKLREGKDGTIFAYGRLVEPAMQAAEKLASQSLEFTVYNARFAKPLDEEALIEAAEKRILVTAEDHVLPGGFGSGVAELLSEKNLNPKFIRIGIPDELIAAGTPAELDQKLGLDAEGIVKQILTAEEACLNEL